MLKRTAAPLGSRAVQIIYQRLLQPTGRFRRRSLNLIVRRQMIYELYSSSSVGCTAYFTRDQHHAEKVAQLEPDAVKVWEYNATTHFEAMQALYDHQGWGKYQRQDGCDDIYDKPI